MRELDLSSLGVGDRVVRTVAESSRFAGLTALDLGHGQIRQEEMALRV